MWSICAINTDALACFHSLFSLFLGVSGLEHEKEGSGKRAEWDKEGKYKYIIRKIGEVHRDVRALQVTLRYITKGLEHEFLFDKDFVRSAVCEDEVDEKILEALKGAGIGGLLPRDVAKRLGSRRITPWNITQRIRRMNRRVERLLGQCAAEKHGMAWALTDFMFESWGQTQEEVTTAIQDLNLEGDKNDFGC